MLEQKAYMGSIIRGFILEDIEWKTFNCNIDKLTSYNRVILLSAIERPGRKKIGEITVFKWMGKLPDEEMIQRCIGDAVTGLVFSKRLLFL